MHPDMRELIPLLVNRAAHAAFEKDDLRTTLKKLRRLQTVLKVANRKDNPNRVAGFVGRLRTLLG